MIICQMIDEDKANQVSLTSTVSGLRVLTTTERSLYLMAGEEDGGEACLRLEWVMGRGRRWCGGRWWH